MSILSVLFKAAAMAECQREAVHEEFMAKWLQGDEDTWGMSYGGLREGYEQRAAQLRDVGDAAYEGLLRELREETVIIHKRE